MSIGTMTSKGQITVPKDVREALALTPGTKVSFTRNAEGDFVLSTSRPSLSNLAGRLRYSGPAISLDDMDVAIAEGAAGS
jgi:antitoxin PrlF